MWSRYETLPVNSYRSALLFALLSAVGFAVQDSVVKILAHTGSIWQLMLIRSFLVIMILWLWTRLRGGSTVITPNGWRWPIIRAVFMSLAYTLFYSSYPYVSLSEAASCFFTAPMFVCLFAGIFLKESIGIYRIMAVCGGFCGALLIIQPGATEFRPILILPVFAGAAYAMGVTVTRAFCSDQPSLALTAVHNLFYAFIGALVVSFMPLLPIDTEMVAKNPFIFREWVPLSGQLLTLIGATSFTHIVAMTASIRAYQSAETVLIAPIEYSYLIFAAAIDFFLWQVVPGALHVLGAMLIFGSGSLIAVREWKAGQRA